jgi:SAM-dependent methyltransferase
MKKKLSLPALVSLKLKQILFPGSKEFWETRYSLGGNSGQGSYGKFADFKANALNEFVRGKAILSVIEFGCGDGNQLSLSKYPKYIGLDVSPTAISLCREKFNQDKSKSFFLYNPSCFVDRQNVFLADLCLSLDVIYHLVEDDVYHAYMDHLFSASKRFVIVYSSDMDQAGGAHARHVRHRNFSLRVKERFPGWKLLEKIKNPYPGRGDFGQGSFADFFIFKKNESS